MESKLPARQARLPRLAEQSYRGLVSVHWTMAVRDRATGWLDAAHHAALRELLLHTCHRYALACPVYCVMPDHAHFLWIGFADASDQRLAAAWFRRQWSALLAPQHELQRQGHDHVLREAERTHDAFAIIADYILRNPEPAELVGSWHDWSYLGAIFPGVYPLDPRAPGYWERFWREHHRAVNPVALSP